MVQNGGKRSARLETFQERAGGVPQAGCFKRAIGDQRLGHVMQVFLRNLKTALLDACSVGATDSARTSSNWPTLLETS